MEGSVRHLAQRRACALQTHPPAPVTRGRHPAHRNSHRHQSRHGQGWKIASDPARRRPQSLDLARSRSHRAGQDGGSEGHSSRPRNLWAGTHAAAREPDPRRRRAGTSRHQARAVSPGAGRPVLVRSRSRDGSYGGVRPFYLVRTGGAQRLRHRHRPVFPRSGIFLAAVDPRHEGKGNHAAGPRRGPPHGWPLVPALSDQRRNHRHLSYESHAGPSGVRAKTPARLRAR